MKDKGAKIMTKKEKFLEVLKYVGEREDLTDFIQGLITDIDTRASKAKAKRQTKSAASDAMADAIAEIVGSTPMTADDIVAALGDETATAAKVQYRARALAEDGILMKTEIKIGKSTKVAYTHI